MRVGLRDASLERPRVEALSSSIKKVVNTYKEDP